MTNDVRVQIKELMESRQLKKTAKPRPAGSFVCSRVFKTEGEIAVERGERIIKEKLKGRSI